MTTEPKIVTHSLKDWDCPEALAYFSYKDHSIHILTPLDMYQCVLKHELQHNERRTFFTSWLSVLASPQVIIASLFLLFISTVANWGSILALDSVFLLLVCISYIYEEVYMDKRLMKRSIDSAKTEHQKVA